MVFTNGGESVRIVINISNEEILDKLLWFLKHFEKDGVEIAKEEKNKKVEWTDEYIEKYWKELGMKTNSPDIDDDERLYEAAREFYNEKYNY